jgi:protein-tyrosine phosphatase
MAGLKKIVFPKDLPMAKREAHRRIGFSGAHNFRDLGGYRNSDGATVKWGLLYRADGLHHLSRRDVKALSRLGLARIIDFRAEFEQEKDPDRLPDDPKLKVVAIPIFDANSLLGKEVRERITAGKLDGLDPEGLLHEAYLQFVSQFTPQYRAFFQEVLAAEGKPILFHCTAGKDRTGFAAALLLSVLGVPMETIRDDYLLTQVYGQKVLAPLYFYVRLVRGKRAMEMVQRFAAARASYLQAAFDAIDSTYGSFEAYVREGLGLSDADLKRLRDSLLEL